MTEVDRIKDTNMDIMISYKNMKIFEKNGVYTVGGSDNSCFDDCTLENLGCGVDEFEMVEYCLRNDIKLGFNDLRGGICDVPYNKYLEHLEKYQTDKECSFLDHEFVVPVVRFSSLDEAKAFIDWVSIKLREQDTILSIRETESNYQSSKAHYDLNGSVNNMTWSYGETFFSEFPELRCIWSNDLETGLMVADRYFDYLWDISENGEIILTDRLYADGISDGMTHERELADSLVLRFDNINELFLHFLPQTKRIVALTEDPVLIAAAEHMENRNPSYLRKTLKDQIQSAVSRAAEVCSAVKPLAKESTPDR